LEALLANEFQTKTLTCGNEEMVPSGLGYGPGTPQTCSIVGTLKGERSVSGSVYVSPFSLNTSIKADFRQLDTKYGFSAGNTWRNIGILWACVTV
jgi:ATP-binding cassette subfamily G (WHITE) protein 2 (SNQ2)